MKIYENNNFFIFLKILKKKKEEARSNIEDIPSNSHFPLFRV